MGIAFVTSMLIADRTTNDVFHYYEQMYVADADYWVLVMIIRMMTNRSPPF